MRFNVVFLF